MPSKKYIFLDFDGPLNTDRNDYKDTERYGHHFDDMAVQNLRRIIDKTGALIVVAFLCSLCRDSSSPSFPVRVDNDSLYVENAYFFSNPFAIPLVFEESDYDYDDSGDEEFRQARLRDPRRVRIRFTEPVNSYLVQVVLHPDDANDDVGMAEWSFKKGKNIIRINTGFYWRWTEDIGNQINDDIKYRGETYVLTPAPEMLQGRDSVIHDTPFCFKDVDFDGEYELCFRAPGYNRHYFNPYKIVSATRVELMTGHPYNNIIYYDDIDDNSTVFNYGDHTIHIWEEDGSSVYGHLYGRREVIEDVLNPMRHIRGIEVNYGIGANYDFFEDGEWVNTIRFYPLDDSSYEFVAEYVAIAYRTFSLQTLKCYSRDTDKERCDDWQVLYKHD